MSRQAPPEFHELQRTYLAYGVGATSVVGLVGLFEQDPPAAAQALRLVLILGGLAFASAIRRPHDGRLRAILAVGLLMTLLLVQAWLRSPLGWPSNLDMVPATVAFSAITIGLDVAVALTVVGVLADVAMFVHLRDQPYTLFNFTNSVLGLVAAPVLLGGYIRGVAAGARELAASDATLRRVERSCAALVSRVSAAILGDVATLAEALDRRPAEAAEVAERLASTLRESRADLPSEPDVPAISLGEALGGVQARTTDLLLLFALLGATVPLVRDRWFTPHGPNQQLMALSLAVSAMLVAIRLAWPHRRGAVLTGVVAVHGSVSLGMLWRWYTIAPTQPPNLVLLLTGATLVAAAGGVALALCTLGFTVVLTGLAWRHNGDVSWVGTFNVVLATATVCLLIDRVPAELLARLQSKRDATLAQVRLQRRLVATLFHDLAGPLQVAVAGIDEIAEGHATPEIARDTRAVVARMQNTLDAAIGGLPRREAFGLEAPLRDLRSNLQARLHQKGLRLSILGDVTLRAIGDETLFRDSVLGNLLSNAVKFSPHDQVIEIDIRADGADVHVTVADRGPGLPDEVKAALEAGRRIDSRPGTDGEPGSGFGLMLARDYAALMGGDLAFTARRGGGLRATVRLPAARPVAQA